MPTISKITLQNCCRAYLLVSVQACSSASQAFFFATTASMSESDSTFFGFSRGWDRHLLYKRHVSREASTGQSALSIPLGMLRQTNRSALYAVVSVTLASSPHRCTSSSHPDSSLYIMTALTTLTTCWLGQRTYLDFLRHRHATYKTYLSYRVS
jgi:hypothetical protein